MGDTTVEPATDEPRQLGLTQRWAAPAFPRNVSDSPQIEVP